MIRRTATALLGALVAMVGIGLEVGVGTDRRPSRPEPPPPEPEHTCGGPTPDERQGCIACDFRVSVAETRDSDALELAQRKRDRKAAKRLENARRARGDR